jgi:hypothetical protein
VFPSLSSIRTLRLGGSGADIKCYDSLLACFRICVACRIQSVVLGDVLADINLTQADADVLLAMEKHKAEDTPYEYPTGIFLITARPRMVPNRAWNVEHQVDRLPLMVSLSNNSTQPGIDSENPRIQTATQYAGDSSSWSLGQRCRRLRYLK